MTIERDKGFRVKTIADKLDNPTAKKGDAVTIVGGAFEGWKGKVVDFDGIWRTIECERATP